MPRSWLGLLSLGVGPSSSGPRGKAECGRPGLGCESAHRLSSFGTSGLLLLHMKNGDSNSTCLGGLLSLDTDNAGKAFTAVLGGNLISVYKGIHSTGYTPYT